MIADYFGISMCFYCHKDLGISLWTFFGSKS